MGLFDPINSTKVQYQGAGQVAGSNIAASGTSGVASYVGPWMVERQRLDIDYVRVPRNQFDSATSASLSGCNWTFRAPSYSKLDARIAAHYSKTKVNEPFTTSAYLQNQTFEINSVSSDADGMIYGNSSEFTASCLGPMGSINTLEEWYHRRKWNDLIDTEVDKTILGYNVGSYSGVPACIGKDVEPWFGNMRRTPWAGDPGTPLDSTDPKTIWTGMSYYINGPYSYNRESMGQIVSFIDNIGDILHPPYSGFFDNPVVMNETQCYPTHTIFLDEYDSSRHQWL